MKKKAILSVLIFFIVGLGESMSRGFYAKGRVLNISFMVSMTGDYERSDQFAIWLEKPDGTFVKTLFLSDYLSYGGYNDPLICSDWSSNTNWTEASEEEFDAVTGPTPQIGEVNLELSIPRDQVPDGEYNIFIEVHLTDKFNELYSGLVQVSRKKFSNQLQVSYRPEKYTKATNDVLSDVRISLNE